MNYPTAEFVDTWHLALQLFSHVRLKFTTYAPTFKFRGDYLLPEWYWWKNQYRARAVTEWPHPYPVFSIQKSWKPVFMLYLYHKALKDGLQISKQHSTSLKPPQVRQLDYDPGFQVIPKNGWKSPSRPRCRRPPPPTHSALIIIATIELPSWHTIASARRTRTPASSDEVEL